MAMGIVSDSEFDSELIRNGINSDKKESKKEVDTIITTVEKGRGQGNLAVPNTLRKVIGETAVINGRSDALDLAKNFGVSPSSVSAYTNGSTSTSSYDKQPNLDYLNKARIKVQSRARKKLMAALNHITDDKLGSSKAAELSGIAKDMSAVIKNMEPDTPKVDSGEKGPTFVFYAPQHRKEETFDVVYAKD